MNELASFSQASRPPIAANRMSLALIVEGKLYMLGDNEHGTLGTGDRLSSSKFRQVPIPGIVEQVDTCHTHTAVITDEGRMYTFGANFEGELALGEINDLDEPTRDYLSPRLVPIQQRIISVSVRENFTAFITEDGKLHVVGAITGPDVGNSERSDEWFREPVVLETPDNVVEVSVGRTHLSIITENGKLYTAGESKVGALGTGKLKGYEGLAYGDEQQDAFDSDLDEEEGGAGYERYSDSACNEGKSHMRFTEVLFNEPVIAVSSRWKHSAVITASGKLYTYGSNSHGQLGTDDGKNHLLPTLIATAGKVVAISTNHYHTAFITEDGKLYRMGVYQCSKRYAIRAGIKSFARVDLPTLVRTTRTVTDVAVGEDRIIYRTDGGSFCEVIDSNTPNFKSKIEIATYDSDLTVDADSGVRYFFDSPDYYEQQVFDEYRLS